MSDHREWVVNLTATTEHEYKVLARTAEEAEAIAEDMFASGDEGDVVSTSIEETYAATGVFADSELIEEDIEFES